jgi:hypothetical protein
MDVMGRPLTAWSSCLERAFYTQERHALTSACSELVWQQQAGESDSWDAARITGPVPAQNTAEVLGDTVPAA